MTTGALNRVSRARCHLSQPPSFSVEMIDVAIGVNEEDRDSCARFRQLWKSRPEVPKLSMIWERDAVLCHWIIHSL